MPYVFPFDRSDSHETIRSSYSEWKYETERAIFDYYPQ